MTHSTPFAARRARLAAQLGAGGVAVIPTAPEQRRNRDSDFPYRHDSYFYYLTGFTEPGAWLVLDATGRSTLFCRPKDAEREVWTGVRLGPQAAPDALGVDAAYSAEELAQRLPPMLAGAQALWLPFGVHTGLLERAEGWLAQVRAKARDGASAPTQMRDVCALLDEMRLVKDESELTLMRRAGAISAEGHMRAMRRCAAMLRAGEQPCEHHLEAELLHAFRDAGAQGVAYPSIVAAGANACVLHYPAGSAPCRAGEMVLIDAGCELDGYAGDISRTFPANGRFTGAQRALYEVVLAAQQAAISACRAGARFDAPHEACLRTLSQGLLDLGLLSRNRCPDVQAVLEQRAYQPFYMHRTSHWLGMDVHDCGSTTEPGEGKAARVLRPGMVLTIEPGLYVRPADGVPEKYWNFGIRIEDDAIVTEAGCELITRDVPVRVEEIEALMRG